MAANQDNSFYTNNNGKPYDSWARKYTERKCVTVRYTNDAKPRSPDDVTAFYEVVLSIHNLSLPVYDDYMNVGTGTDVRFIFSSTEGAEKFHRSLRTLNWDTCGIVSLKWVDLQASRKQLGNGNIVIITTQINGEAESKVDTVSNYNSGGLFQPHNPQARSYRSMLESHRFPDSKKTPERGTKTPIMEHSPGITHPSLFGRSIVSVEEVTAAAAKAASSLVAAAAHNDSTNQGVQTPNLSAKPSSNSSGLLKGVDTTTVIARPTTLDEANDRVSALQEFIMAAAVARTTPEDITEIRSEYDLLKSSIAIHEMMGGVINFAEAMDMAKKGKS